MFNALILKEIKNLQQIFYKFRFNSRHISFKYSKNQLNIILHNITINPHFVIDILEKSFDKFKAINSNINICLKYHSKIRDGILWTKR